MGLVVATTAGLVIWIALWAVGAKSFDSFMIAIVIMLVAATARIVAPHLPGNKSD